MSLVDGQQLQAQSQAGQFASTAEDYARAERNAGCRAAVAILVKSGNRRLAHDVLMTSFTRQLRIHGLGYAAIPGRPYDQMGDLP